MLEKERVICLKVEEYERLKRSEEFFRQVCDIFKLDYGVLIDCLDDDSESNKISITMGVDPKEMLFDIFRHIQNQRDNEELLKKYLIDMGIYFRRIKEEAQLAEDISKECESKLKSLFCDIIH